MKMKNSLKKHYLIGIIAVILLLVVGIGFYIQKKAATGVISYTKLLALLENEQVSQVIMNQGATIQVELKNVKPI